MKLTCAIESKDLLLVRPSLTEGENLLYVRVQAEVQGATAYLDAERAKQLRDYLDAWLKEKGK